MSIKHTNLLWVLAALLFGTTFSSCSDDNDDPYIYKLDFKRASLQYNEDNVWTGAFTTDALYINPFSFAHWGSPDYGGYFRGYVPSKSTDSQYYDDMLSHQFDVIAGGASTGAGNPFLVCFWNSSEAADAELKDRSTIFYVKKPVGTQVAPFTPRSMKICNTSYTYYTMLKGNAFSRQFQQGDYLKVIAHGVMEGGGEKTSEFYLARCEGAEKDWFVTNWTSWNLSSLGEVIGIYFTMESSDTGQWGMNTPAYFAMDALDVACRTNELVL